MPLEIQTLEDKLNKRADVELTGKIYQALVGLNNLDQALGLNQTNHEKITIKLNSKESIEVTPYWLSQELTTVLFDKYKDQYRTVFKNKFLSQVDQMRNQFDQLIGFNEPEPEK